VERAVILADPGKKIEAELLGINPVATAKKTARKTQAKK
jgi:hypothetical protein